MSPRTAYLPVLNTYRGLLDTAWDLRQFSVLVRVNTWTGPLAGQGAKATVDTPLVCNGGRVHVVQVTSQDVIASGGLYQDQDLRVGPLTPPYTDATGNPAGTVTTAFDPSPMPATTEVLFQLTGPGIASAGAWYKKVNTNTLANFRYEIVLRATGQAHA